jgi:hypothetical protein
MSKLTAERSSIWALGSAKFEGLYYITWPFSCRGENYSTFED